MKRKVVNKAVFHCDKCRIKAMKIVVSAAGVTGLELQCDDSNQLVVTGYGIDSAGLTMLIRKKFGSAEIVSHTSISIPEKETAPPIVSTPVHCSANDSAASCEQLR